MRICDICGVIDDGPRHVIAHAPGEVPINGNLIAEVSQRELPSLVRADALESLADTTLQIRHPACCAAAGCDICTQEN